MKLRSARLCLDCDEVHDAYRCPACTSESFAYITRWVPEPEREARQADTPPPTEEKDGDEQGRGGRRVLKNSLVGIAAVGAIGWLLGRRKSHEW
jgi:hypothetical protein